MEKWHGHEERIEKALTNYYKAKGYHVAVHRASDLFDIILASVDNNKVQELIGIEIKSDQDNIKRLYDQLPNYLYVFDKVYVALENKNVCEEFPFPIGIIKVNGSIIVEREAKRLKFSPNKFITKSATVSTIGKSNGVKKRVDELLIYLSEIENVKKKLLFNSLFYENLLPFTPEENTIVDFIIHASANDLEKRGIFKYEFGNILIGK